MKTPQQVYTEHKVKLDSIPESLYDFWGNHYNNLSKIEKKYYKRKLKIK